MSKVRFTVPVFVPHMGCPHRCVFCDQKAATGAVTIPTPESIREKVLAYVATGGYAPRHAEIGFFGGTFTGIPAGIRRPLLAAARELREAGIVESIRISTRPDMIDSSVLEELRESGVGTVELGAQSFDDDVLAASGRGHTAEQTASAARMITSAGMELGIQLMPGLPGDTRETSVRSAHAAAGLGPACARIYPACVFAGTGLESLWRLGLYSPIALDEAVDTCAAMHAVFDAAGITVIRTGLHPISPEAGEAIVAGPYHPSFGHMVKSRLKRDALDRELAARGELHARDGRARVVARVPERLCEQFRGPGRGNISYLAAKYGLSHLAVAPGRGPGIELEITHPRGG